MKNKITVFSLSSSKKLAQDIASILGTKVGDCKVHHFADGEILCEIGESVRGKDVFIVQSTSNPVTENLMEILVLTDALKRASAREITAVIPYFGYARQDRKAKPRQPITSKLVADLLTTAGVNRVVTVDLHAAQIQGFFDIPVDEMQALPLLIKYFRKKKVQDLCVVSPDHGGATRARKMSEAFDCPIAIIDKRRPKPNVAEVMGIIGNVEGKNCILIDDMIDTAGTITAGVDMLKQKGAKDVYLHVLMVYFLDLLLKDYLLVLQKKLLLLTLSKFHKKRNLINLFLYLLQDYLHIQLKISKTIYQLVTYSLSMIVNVEDSLRVLFRPNIRLHI